MHKNSHIDKWDRVKSAEINLHINGQLIFDKEDKNLQCSKDSLLKKWHWEKWTYTCKKMKNETRSPSYTTQEEAQNG